MKHMKQRHFYQKIIAQISFGCNTRHDIPADKYNISCILCGIIFQEVAWGLTIYDEDDLEYKETFLALNLQDSLCVQFYGQKIIMIFHATCVETSFKRLRIWGSTIYDDDDLEYKETFLAPRLQDSLCVQFYDQQMNIIFPATFVETLFEELAWELTIYDDDDLEYKETFLAPCLQDSLCVQFYGQRRTGGELPSITYLDCYIVLLTASASAFSSTHPAAASSFSIFDKSWQDM